MRFKYIDTDGHEIGVSDASDLRDLLALGVVRDETLVFDAAEQRWGRASTFVGIRPALTHSQESKLPRSDTAEPSERVLGQAQSFEFADTSGQSSRTHHDWRSRLFIGLAITSVVAGTAIVLWLLPRTTDYNNLVRFVLLPAIALNTAAAYGVATFAPWSWWVSVFLVTLNCLAHLMNTFDLERELLFRMASLAAVALYTMFAHYFLTHRHLFQTGDATVAFDRRLAPVSMLPRWHGGKIVLLWIGVAVLWALLLALSADAADIILGLDVVYLIVVGIAGIGVAALTWRWLSEREARTNRRAASSESQPRRP